jgi:predicted transcriptional regulator
MERTPMSVTTVRLQPELEENLGAMAKKLQRSKSWLINQALREFFERRAVDQSRWQETLQAMESVAQGRVVSGEAVNTWLQSWGNPDELSPPTAGQ